jgi:hypothetical protein
LRPPLKTIILTGIIERLSEDTIKNVVVVVKLSWLIINILAKIKQAKMDIIVFVNVVEIPKVKKYNYYLSFC